MGVFHDSDGVLCITFWYHGTLVGNEGAEAYEGPLRAKIRLGEEFTVRSGGPTDEGYSYRTDTYSFVEDEDGDMFVMAECSVESRDCDGRMDRFSRHRMVNVASCPDFYDNEILYPFWEKMKLNRGEYAQRDYTAEAAGY